MKHNLNKIISNFSIFSIIAFLLFNSNVQAQFCGSSMALFTHNAVPCSTGTSVTFYPLATIDCSNTSIRHLWTFSKVPGDGIAYLPVPPSPACTASVSFPHDGAYLVTHSVQIGTCIYEYSEPVTISFSLSYTGSFTYSQNPLGCVEEVTFTADEPLANHIWSFPGGVPNDATTPVVTVVYETPGSHSATHYAYTNSGCSSPAYSTNFSTIAGVPIPDFNISGTPSTNIQNESIICSGNYTFQAVTTGPQYAHAWVIAGSTVLGPYTTDNWTDNLAVGAYKITHTIVDLTTNCGSHSSRSFVVVNPLLCPSVPHSPDPNPALPRAAVDNDDSVDIDNVNHTLSDGVEISYHAPVNKENILEVYELATGRKMLTKHIKGGYGQVIIEKNELAVGIYIVQLISESKTQTVKKLFVAN